MGTGAGAGDCLMRLRVPCIPRDDFNQLQPTFVTSLELFLVRKIVFRQRFNV